VGVSAVRFETDDTIGGATVAGKVPGMYGMAFSWCAGSGAEGSGFRSAVGFGFARAPRSIYGMHCADGERLFTDCESYMANIHSIYFRSCRWEY